MKIALVCGEASGDALGAGLARAILELDPSVELSGVTGPLMRSAGVSSWLDCSRFSVMGYLEAVRRLPVLLSSRNEVVRRMDEERPEVVVGIDAPDLNLKLGRRARTLGAKYVQYVCPSFWAWRPKRAGYLARHCDLVLALLPFETGLCEKAGINSRFVGHRMADEIQPTGDARAISRKALGIDEGASVLALLPGSRSQEIDAHAGLFAKTASLCVRDRQGLQVWWAPRDGLDASLPGVEGARTCPGKARILLAASDVALVKSGTITLEAALLDCPQVVAYAVGPISAFFAKRKLKDVHGRHYGLPNLVAGRKVVPEFIQDRAVAADIADSLASLLDGKGVDEMKSAYRELRSSLEGGADAKAAAAVLEIAG